MPYGALFSFKFSKILIIFSQYALNIVLYYMNPIKKVWLFYYEGFSQMTVGKYLWLLIFIKLFILFFVLKLFFFKNELSKFDTPDEKRAAVIDNLLNK